MKDIVINFFICIFSTDIVVAATCTVAIGVVFVIVVVVVVVNDVNNVAVVVAAAHAMAVFAVPFCSYSNNSS